MRYHRLQSPPLVLVIVRPPRPVKLGQLLPEQGLALAIEVDRRAVLLRQLEQLEEEMLLNLLVPPVQLEVDTVEVGLLQLRLLVVVEEEEEEEEEKEEVLDRVTLLRQLRLRVVRQQEQLAVRRQRQRAVLRTDLFSEMHRDGWQFLQLL